jgi:nicotinate-nucleotide pyrophosphorylase (carboxylating)
MVSYTDHLTEGELDEIIDLALHEDTSHGDVTSEALLPRDLEGRASMLVKGNGVLAGIDIAGRVFSRIDPSLKMEVLINDGAAVHRGNIAAVISGKVAGILKGERLALNFLQRLSGIASLTARYVAEVSGTDARICDTRKTLPGLRMLEKYAVRMGGGHNHRFHLGDAILIKDNHLAALRSMGMNLNEIMAKARQNAPAGITVEVEVTSTEEALAAVAAGADIVMLDNMSLYDMGQAVKSINGQAKIEASGGIKLENVREVALTGVDIISVGSITHSPPALDISIELETKLL